jgi:hypothetical protein
LSASLERETAWRGEDRKNDSLVGAVAVANRKMPSGSKESAWELDSAWKGMAQRYTYYHAGPFEAQFFALIQSVEAVTIGKINLLYEEVAVASRERASAAEAVPFLQTLVPRQKWRMCSRG